MDSNAESQAYNANLDYTLKELQKKVKEHEDELERVSTPNKHSTHKIISTKGLAASIKGG